MYNIKTDKFEGPLGLLLKLIEKEEMDITKVSLAKIADQYISYIKSSPKINPESMADFLVIASKLLLIKSKALLPYLCPEEDEEIEEFALQLKMYKEFLEATKSVESMIKAKKFMFIREFNKKTSLSLAGADLNLFSPPKKLVKNDLRLVFREIINNIKPPEEKLQEKELESQISIDDKILELQKLLISKLKISFSKILRNTKSKTEVIVSFLAMLELIKQREVRAEQYGLFKEIVLNRNG